MARGGVAAYKGGVRPCAVLGLALLTILAACGREPRRHPAARLAPVARPAIARPEAFCPMEIIARVRDGRTEEAIALDRNCVGYVGAHVADALLVDARFAEAHAKYLVAPGFTAPGILAALAVGDRRGAIATIEAGARRWRGRPASERCLAEALRAELGDRDAASRLRADTERECVLLALDAMPEAARRAALERLLAAEPASTDWWVRVLLLLEIDPRAPIDLGRELGLPDCNTEYLLWRHGSAPRAPAILARVGEHLDEVRSAPLRAAIAAGLACFEASAGEHDRARPWIERAAREAHDPWQARLIAEVAGTVAIRRGDAGARVDLDAGAVLSALRIARGERIAAFAGWQGRSDERALAALARGDLATVARETGAEPAWVWPLIAAPALDAAQRRVLRDEWLRGAHRLPSPGAANQELGWQAILADAARALGDERLEVRHRRLARAWRELLLRRELAIALDLIAR